MTDIKELNDLQTISANFKNLGFANLMVEEIVCADKLEKLLKKIEGRNEILRALDDDIHELEEYTASCGEKLEELDVETIRANKSIKKAEKSLKKLNSMNTTQIKIDVSENDKTRLRKKLAKLAIGHRATGLVMNNKGKGLIVDYDGQIRLMQIKKNVSSKAARKNYLWNEIHQSLKYQNEWRHLSSSTAPAEVMEE